MLNLLIVAPLLISLCAAATRVITGISIEMALLISSPAWIGLLVMTHRTWSSCSDRLQRARYPAIGIALLCVAPFLVFPSYGFVNLGTADGGNHMRFYQSFITDAPDVYHGFVGFYGLLFLTQKLLGVFPEVALLVALGYTIVTLTWLLSLWGLSRGVSTLSVIALNLIVIIPTALALQTNGFYPQLYGLSALVLYLMLCDRPLEVRSIVLLTFLGAGLLRYSYGLTIADLFLASGVYALVRRKLLVSALFLALGVYTTTRLLPVITLPGAFTPIHTASLITAVTLLILGTRERTGLPILLVASSLTVWLTLGVTMGFEHYYVQKYPMGLCLLTGALSLQTLAAAGSAHRKLIVGSLIVLCVAVYPYTKGAIDIVRGRFVNPEVDLTLIHEIRTSLAAANKPFRAFIGSKWPRTNMVNAIFNHEYPYQDYVTGTLPVGAGCLFFDATDGIVNRLKKDRLPELSRAIDTLLREQHTRTTYAAPWNDEGSLTLGMTCER